MENPKRIINISIAELLDRLTIHQIKEIFDQRNEAGHEKELCDIEGAIDDFFGQHPTPLDAYLIRLVVALAEINLHIWQAKESMEEGSRFREDMKLAHQLNGVRNQLKNLVLQEVSAGQGDKKTNDQSEDLPNWKISILGGRAAFAGSLKCVADENTSSARALYPAIADLIDEVTISQIKEAFFMGDKKTVSEKRLSALSHDIDLALNNKIKASAHLVRLVIFLAQANFYVWRNKERMQQEPEKYDELLERAQDLNSLRNYVKNLLMEEFGEGTPARRKAIFFGLQNEQWYKNIIDSIERGRPSKNPGQAADGRTPRR